MARRPKATQPEQLNIIELVPELTHLRVVCTFIRLRRQMLKWSREDLAEKASRHTSRGRTLHYHHVYYVETLRWKNLKLEQVAAMLMALGCQVVSFTDEYQVVRAESKKKRRSA